METLDGGFVYPAMAEVALADVTSLVGRHHPILKMLHGKLVERQQCLTLTLLAALLVGQLMLLDFDMVFPGEIAQRLPVGHLLMLHDEVDRASPLAAAETLAYPLGRGNRERGGALIVKRAEADVIGPPALEAHEVRDHLHDVGGVDDSLYGLAVYY